MGPGPGPMPDMGPHGPHGPAAADWGPMDHGTDMSGPAMGEPGWGDHATNWGPGDMPMPPMPMAENSCAMNQR